MKNTISSKIFSTRREKPTRIIYTRATKQRSKNYFSSDYRGSALIYILIAIALLGALTMAFVEPSGQQSRTQNSFKVATQLRDQAEAYRAAIQDCILTYPGGDTSTGAALYSGYNSPYPVTPSSTYLPVGLRDSGNLASSLRCPGNPGTSNSHTAIFGGTTGRFAPVKIGLMDDWTYTNDSTGVYLLARTNKTDQYLQDGMTKADALYSTCEADYISDGSAPCASGYYCLRVWVIRATCP